LDILFLTVGHGFKRHATYNELNNERFLEDPRLSLPEYSVHIANIKALTDGAAMGGDYGRLKQVIGDDLRSRIDEYRASEFAMAVQALGRCCS
jgi:hypothetical protein